MKYHQPRPLSEFTEECIGPVLTKQGFASTDLVLGWGDIVGDKLAESCVPIRIKWPTNRHIGPDDVQEPATLMLRVESAFALDVQHLIPVIIERVNARYGWRCIGKVILQQGPVRSKPKRRPPVDLTAATEKAADRVGVIEDPALRDALIRLGAGIIGAAKADGNGRRSLRSGRTAKDPA